MAIKGLKIFRICVWSIASIGMVFLLVMRFAGGESYSIFEPYEYYPLGILSIWGLDRAFGWTERLLGIKAGEEKETIKL